MIGYRALSKPAAHAAPALCPARLWQCAPALVVVLFPSRTRPRHCARRAAPALHASRARGPGTVPVARYPDTVLVARGPALFPSRAGGPCTVPFARGHGTVPVALAAPTLPAVRSDRRTVPVIKLVGSAF